MKSRTYDNIDMDDPNDHALTEDNMMSIIERERERERERARERERKRERERGKERERKRERGK